MSTRPALAIVAVALALGLTAGFAPRHGAAEAAPVAGTAPSTFEIDPIHSTALFRVHHLGAGQFWGRFNDVTGTITFDEGSASDLAFDVSIAIESVDTNAEGLDRHLKSPDFFNVREHPAMTFRSSSARKIDDMTYEVAGTITIRGISKPLTTRMTWTGSAQKMPQAGYRCGFETTFTLERSEFEVLYGVESGAVGDETRVVVSLEAKRQ